MSISKPNIDAISGEWRRPHNDLREQHVGGGHKAIHDEKTAAAVGFKGAPIHGTVHFSQFTPLLLKAFGPAWFECGTFSVHFRTPVTHLQPVKAFIERPKKKNQQCRIWMEHVDGQVVFEGTASCGLKKGQEVTMAESRISKIKPVKGGLLFVRREVGTQTLNIEKACLKFDQVIGPLFPFSVNDKLEIITEWHPWFSKEFGSSSPWGAPIVTPEGFNQIMFYNMVTSRWPQMKQKQLAKYDGIKSDGRTPVGLFGGCEIRIVNGPIFMNHEYHIKRELVAAGETRKTEFTWTRTIMIDPKTKKVIAEMLLQNMMLKGSYTGYNKMRSIVNENVKKIAKL